MLRSINFRVLIATKNYFPVTMKFSSQFISIFTFLR